MSDHDIVRARRQRLIFLMETKPNDPNYHVWKAEYDDLCPKTSAPRNAVTTKCEGPRGYPPVSPEQVRTWAKSEHVNPQANRGKGGRL